MFYERIQVGNVVGSPQLKGLNERKKLVQGSLQKDINMIGI